MRKLYALFTGIVVALLTTTSVNSRSVTPDIANFTFTVDAPNNNVVFVNTSVLGSEPGLRKAFWSFGDGTGQMTPPLQGTQHHYASSGTYTVCLRIYRYFTNTLDSVLTAQVCKTVVIESSCQADFTTTGTSSNPLGKYFIAQPWHSQNKKPLRICWNFGDGRDTCIHYSTTYTGVYGVYHLYTQPGNYNACVNILYDGGCEAHSCHTVQVNPPDSCGADFERIPSTNINPLLTYFRALPQHNNNRKPSRICWTFGDNRDTCINYTENFTGQYVVSHRYLQPGQYEVCVKINYFGGCEARKCKPILVGRPDTCHADFERIPATNSVIPLLTYFRALPQHNNNRKPSRICWTFGDNRDTCINYTETYTGQYVVSHLYLQPGQYEVCVKIIYFGGCEARMCKPILVQRPDTCHADFERIPSTTINPLLTYFRALPQHNNNRKPSRICWTFGDNRDTCINYTETYSGQYVVSHLYLQPGTYEVCVKIQYFGGCEARNCHPVIISPPQENCTVHLFEIVPSITSLVRGFYASASSTPPRRPERICWYFGDGTDTCIMIDPVLPIPVFLIRHVYPGPGVYRACVKVRFQGGCIAEDCKEVVIRSSSNTCGGFMIDSMTAPRSFKFKGFSIHAPNDHVLNYHWTFGDGTGAFGPEVTHTYNQGGNYPVCLTITTQLGCETRICKTLRVPGNNEPTLHLSPNPVIHDVHVDFLSTHTEQATIKILNSIGVPVRIYVRNVTVGPNSWTHDLGSLVPGVYTYIVQSPNQLASAIFLKQ